MPQAKPQVAEVIPWQDTLGETLRRLLFDTPHDPRYRIVAAKARVTGQRPLAEVQGETSVTLADSPTGGVGVGVGWTTELPSGQFYQSEREVVAAIDSALGDDARELIRDGLRLIVESEVLQDLNGLREWTVQAGTTIRHLTDQDFYGHLVPDIESATTSVLILAPFIGQRLRQLHPPLQAAARAGVDVLVLTRPSYDGPKHAPLLDPLRQAGIRVEHRTNHMHEKIVVIDRSVAYHGSLNPLSHRSTTESITRFACTPIAEALDILYHPHIGQAFAERVETIIDDGMRSKSSWATGHVPDWWKAGVLD